jgi:uncharacterized RDD family membrane protein YckC
MASQYNPYEAPTFDDAGKAEQDEELTLATRGSRLAAAMLDSALIFVPLIAVFLVIGADNGVASWVVFTGDMPNVGEPPAYLMTTLAVVGVLCLLVLGVQCYLLIKSAQTIGKRVLGIQIVNASDGSQTGFGRIFFLRILAIQLASFFPLVGGFVPLIDVLLIFRQDSRCIHDHIAGTIVVRVQR